MPSHRETNILYTCESTYIGRQIFGRMSAPSYHRPHAHHQTYKVYVSSQTNRCQIYVRASYRLIMLSERIKFWRYVYTLLALYTPFADPHHKPQGLIRDRFE